MIDLYALTSPNVLKVILMLEECALPYTLIPVDVWKGEQFSPEFLKINPNAKIPAIVDRDGPGGKPLAVFESAAILMYLAEKTGRFLPKEMAAKYEAIEWMMVQMTGMGPNFGNLVHFRRFGPPGSEYSLSRFGTEARRLYELAEKRLAASPWFGGRDYGIADMATFPWARNFELLGIDKAAHPNVGRWVDTVAARPATVKMLAQADFLMTKSSRDKATPEDIDRLTGRGKFARA